MVKIEEKCALARLVSIPATGNPLKIPVSGKSDLYRLVQTGEAFLATSYH
jgi:hypothetical protein